MWAVKILIEVLMLKGPSRYFAKTQKGHQRFGLALKFCGQKIKVANFYELLEECKLLSVKN